MLESGNVFYEACVLVWAQNPARRLCVRFEFVSCGVLSMTLCLVLCLVLRLHMGDLKAGVRVNFYVTCAADCVELCVHDVVRHLIHSTHAPWPT